MWSELWQFFTAVVRHFWYVTVAGWGLTGLVDVYERWRSSKLSWKSYISVLGICLLISLFLAWRDEYKGRLKIFDENTSLRTERDQLRKRLEEVKSKKPIGENCQTIPLSHKEEIKKPLDWVGASKNREGFQFTQKRVAPLRYEIAIKTEAVISAPALLFEYQGEIEQAKDIDWGFISTNAILGNIRVCINDTQPKSFLLSFQREWFPEHPMIITIVAKKPIRIMKVVRTNYIWKSGGD